MAMSFSAAIERALMVGAGTYRRPPEMKVVGRGSLPSCFDVTGLAVASIGAASQELVRFAGTGRESFDSADADAGAGAGADAEVEVEVDRRLASMWFGFTIRPVGWTLPSPWDPIAGDYATRDGWIRLHTNAPLHREAALAVLRVGADRAAVAAAVAGLESESLEAAIVERGGCAAAMRSQADWAEHPQGKAVAREPLVDWQTAPCASDREMLCDAAGPLMGIRVLDLTKVLAGPVATRFLAAWGADVLRIDPPSWDEPAVIPEVSVGKRCTGLDLARAADRAQFESLLAGADVLVHGYRPGALASLGYDGVRIRELNPRLVDVSLCGYGHEGPWSGRRGFDSLVQMSTGIAEAGRRWAGGPRPVPLPVQALDHATGYLMAAAALRGLRLRRDEDLTVTARLSLARTALLLTGASGEGEPASLDAEQATDCGPEVERTIWGLARRLRFPVRIPGWTAAFAIPAQSLRSSPPTWGGGERSFGV